MDSAPNMEVEIDEAVQPATDRDAETGRVFIQPSAKEYKSVDAIEKSHSGIKNVKDLKR